MIGREFSLPRLLRLAELDQVALLTALDEAIDAQLIVAASGAAGRYRFVHDLVRETLYAELSTSERMRLHQRVGTILEELHAADLELHLAELAYHFGQAAPVAEAEKAIDYALRTAERNMGLLAYEEASRHYERALQLLALQEHADLAQRSDLLLALGQAQTRSGQTTQARTTFAQAAELARSLRSISQLAHAALGFAGEVVTPGIANPQVIALLDEALAVLDNVDSPLRARLLGRLAMEYRYAPFPERREELSQRGARNRPPSGYFCCRSSVPNAGY